VSAPPPAWSCGWTERSPAVTSTPTGTIANTKLLSIAGKLDCDQITTTCDYFAGDIDYVKIQRS
jgi:hypothetical protein